MGIFANNVVLFFLTLGQVGQLAGETVISAFRYPIRWRLFFVQLAAIGYGSQMIVLMTGAFTGAVMTAQVYFQFRTLGMETAVGPVVVVALFRELGPVLTGLMVAGRVGAAMCAEIGTMKVTQQIDALRSLAVHPVDYLVVPRALGLFVAMPFLAIECVCSGIAASYATAHWILNIETAYYLSNILSFTAMSDILMTVVKGFFFAWIIVFISCREGLEARNGAVGVGRAITQTVVACSMTILVFNFFLSMMLNMVFPAGLSR